MTMYSTIRPRDENWFVVNEYQRLQKSNQHPRFVRVFSIIFILTTIGFGSYFFFKLIVDNKNLSSQLTSMKTNIEAMERKFKNIQLDCKNLSSQMTSLETNIGAIKDSMDTNQISQLAENIYNTVERHAMEATDKVLEEKFSRSLDVMNAAGKIIWKFDNYESRIGKVKETVYYSDPFYSSQFGYKMRISCNVTETCVQLGIITLIGSYDNLLTKPSRTNITFSIIDQSKEPVNIPPSLVVTPMNDCESEFNQENNGKVHCETPCRMVTREMLSSRNYIRNDTLYIAAIVVARDYFDLELV